MTMLLDWDTLSNEFNNKTKNINLSAGVACDSIRSKVFLSHRYLDKDKIEIIKYKLESYGYDVFVDWMEESLQDRANVDKKVAKTILTKMKECDVLLFVITENSIDSIWMAWELGLFHGQNGIGRVALMPIVDNSNGKHIKAEFLQLYPYVDECNINGRDTKSLWVNDPKHYPENFKKYVIFDDWITKNVQPYKR